MLGSVQTAPVDRVVEVIDAAGMLGVDKADDIRATDGVEEAKISEAEVHGQTVMVDSTVMVTIAVALRAKSPVARTAPDNCILTDVEELWKWV